MVNDMAALIKKFFRFYLPKTTGGCPNA